MKYYAAHVLALASVAAAYPYPQELPSTTEPGAGSDTGAGTGTGGGSGLGGLFPGLGGGSSLPSLGGGSGLPGLGGGSGLPGLGGGSLTLPTKLPSLGGGSGFPGLGGGLGGGFARPTGFPSLGGGSGFPGLGGGSGLGGGLTLPTSLPSLGGGSSFPGLGGGSSLPGLGGIGSSRKAAASDTSIGAGGSSWMDWLSGLTGGLGGGSSAGSDEAAPPASPDTETPSTPATPATPATPGGNSTGGSGGSGGSGGNCKPQQASSGLLGGSENGIVDKNCCTDMTIVFARGTGEMGNVGTVSGPPMFKAIRSKLGADRVTVQGVDYPASAAGNVNLGGDGGEKMAALVKQAKSLCPNTKVIVSGYSQGAMVVHNAFNKGLSAGDVSGAVLFGDPLKRTAVGKLSTDKVKQFCGTADQICGGGGDGGATGSHISYGSSAEAAATFAIQAAGLA